MRSLLLIACSASPELLSRALSDLPEVGSEPASITPADAPHGG